MLAGTGRGKKASTLFSPSSSGAFSSPAGIQTTSSFSLKRTGSPGCRVGDSTLKYSATQATSNYFADKHQELNLPPKFVKQMLRLEKERIKLLEKEKGKIPKSSSSSVKNSISSKQNISTSKNNLKSKNNVLDTERGVDNEKEVDPRSMLRSDTNDVSMKREIERKQDGVAVSASLDDGSRDSAADEKKNSKLGKLGKFSKLARPYNAREGGIGIGSGTGYDGVGVGVGVGDTHTVQGSGRPAVTPNHQNTPDVTDMSVRTPGQGVNPALTPGPTQAPGSSSSVNVALPPTTPGGTQMKMLVHAAGSQLGGMCDDPNPPEVRVHVPNKVGRPKLSFKEKVRKELSWVFCVFFIIILLF